MLFLFLSFLILSCAQPDISPVACILSSCCGFALLWKGISSYSKLKKFLTSFVWFALVEGIHLSWFTADRYVGSFIFLFLLFLVTIHGLCFGLFSLAVNKEINVHKILILSSLWTIFEWNKLFWLSGFSWDPVGLSLIATKVGMQVASLAGVFGMTFLVMLTNLIFYRCLENYSKSRLLIASCLALVPYLFGVMHLSFHQKKMESSKEELSILLLQSSLYPEEKMWLPQSSGPPLHPFFIWKHHLELIKQHEGKKFDLIVFPESAVPWGTETLLYGREEVEALFPGQGLEKDRYSNRDLLECLSRKTGADVIIGLDDVEDQKAYNAAFFVSENGHGRYEKRILVPMGEYIPFEWCKAILKKYGIQDSFSPGLAAKVFPGKKGPIGVTICYEETYGHLMRENRLNGAKLLVNLTNDVWYPKSRLPRVHYHHGKIRAVEMGIPLVRATNTGMTVGLDSLGGVRGSLPYETRRAKAPAEALHVMLPTYTYKTLYSWTGDWGIIGGAVLYTFFTLILARARAPSRAPFKFKKSG